MKIKQSSILLVAVLMMMFAACVLSFSSSGKSDFSGRSHARPQQQVEELPKYVVLKQLLAYDDEQIIKWQEPEPQDENVKWLFDVFTPPRIYLHPETGTFEPESYQYKSVRDFPELEILSVSKPKFRYQLSGFIENNYKNSDSSILLLEDLQTSMIIRIYMQDTHVLDGGFLPVSFRATREFSENGGIQRVGILELESSNGVKTVLKTSATTLIEGMEVCIRFEDKEVVLSDDNRQVVIGNYQIVWEESTSVVQPFVFLLTNLKNSETIKIQK